jgi:outer membrane scaffolding protein for murein synthesis (MipA/OmpV family)
MEKLLVLALAAACGTASAQTPASNPMPDGSRDMYVGLGAVSTPRYEGAAGRKLSALPVLQVQWSNGLFISGLGAGIHLADDPSVEFGPLVAIQPGRRPSGTDSGVGGVGYGGTVRPRVPPPPRPPGHGLDGMDEIGVRLQGGAFFNTYLAPQWRLASSVLYGAGNAHHGAVLELGLQRLAAELARHHTLSLSAGLAVANRDYNQAFFGVTGTEAMRSGYSEYRPAAGLKDVHLGARWNWALSPAWLLTSSLQATRLVAGAKDSPLVERPTNLTVSTAIAYRF